MTLKKLIFCILCFANAAKLATEEDFNDEKSSNSKVEENVLMNKNNWNTRKWGNIYLLSTYYSVKNFEYNKSFLSRQLDNKYVVKFNILFSWVVEYKYMFNKNIGINVRLNLNNIDQVDFFFAFEPSIEWVYGRKGKKIFSGSFSPISFDFYSSKPHKKFFEGIYVLAFYLFKFEYNRIFYLNFGKIKITWDFDDIKEIFFYNILSLEFGLNILGVNDWKKNSKSIKENNLINKNNLNTRRWGSVYFLFTSLNVYSFIKPCLQLKGFLYSVNPILDFFFSFVIEYKYMFDENLGINARLAVNCTECLDNPRYFFSIMPSIEWVYGRKGKKIFSGSFSPLELKLYKLSNQKSFSCDWSFIFFKYENNRSFYLNFGHIKSSWNLPGEIELRSFLSLFANVLSVEIGLNIIGVNDWRKKRK